MKTWMFILMVVIIAGCISIIQAQTTSYNDVLVVINSNSTLSDSIGTYFANARNIPGRHIARIAVPATEEIDSLQFENLRSQLETIITSRGIKDSINYIVTTKGMPLKVLRSNSFTRSSVESELTLILGTYASSIGGFGNITSPYYGKRGDFSRSKYGIYLVTRLDGYTYADVVALIDRSANIPTSISSSAKFVMDADPAWAVAAGYLNTNMVHAADSLKKRSITSVLDTTTVYVTAQTNVLGYVSWGSNDHYWSSYAVHAIPNNTYLTGAIAETYVSTSARSFASPPVYGQSLIADWIAQGITAVKGYVYEPYSGAMADVSILFPMYADGYTVAEAFYSASPYLSWMDVVIGDPKYRVVATRVSLASLTNYSTSSSSSALPVELTSLTAAASAMQVAIRWSTATESNNYGFEIQRRSVANSTQAISEWENVGFVAGSGTSSTAHSYSYTDAHVSAGTYAYRIEQIDNDGTMKTSNETQVVVTAAAKGMTLSNYPNPFNPTTTIEFSVPCDGVTTLKIYNVLGQEVLTAFAGEVKAGTYQHATFDGSKFSSGIYFYSIENNGQKMVKRMMMLK